MTEDFVSFSLTKKLKEKGFRYNKNNLLDRLCMENQINHPSISQVLKWLRIEKKRFVVIHPTGHDVHYYYTVHNLDRSFDTFEYTQSFATYEEAALAGIEYCLDNLI